MPNSHAIPEHKNERDTMKEDEETIKPSGQAGQAGCETSGSIHVFNHKPHTTVYKVPHSPRSVPWYEQIENKIKPKNWPGKHLVSSLLKPANLAEGMALARLIDGFVWASQEHEEHEQFAFRSSTCLHNLYKRKKQDIAILVITTPCILEGSIQTHKHTLLTS